MQATSESTQRRRELSEMQSNYSKFPNIIEVQCKYLCACAVYACAGVTK